MAASYLNISPPLSLPRARNCFHRFRNGVGRLLINGTSRRRDFELRGRNTRMWVNDNDHDDHDGQFVFLRIGLKGWLEAKVWVRSLHDGAWNYRGFNVKSIGELDKRGVWENRILGKSSTLGWKSPEVIGSAWTWETATWKSLPDSSGSNDILSREDWPLRGIFFVGM